MARCTWPMDAAAMGDGVPLGEDARRAARPAPRSITCAASSAAIGGASCCSDGQRGTHGLGQALVEVAGHLADLHEGALHVAERRATCSAVFSSNSASSSSLRSADANTCRARCTAVPGAHRAGDPGRCAPPCSWCSPAPLRDAAPWFLTTSAAARHRREPRQPSSRANEVRTRLCDSLEIAVGQERPRRSIASPRRRL